jgi:hypothetical protein
MDLIYMNDRREDVGLLTDYKFDLAFGRDENDFEVTIPAAEHCCAAGYFLYIPGTEYGGIVDTVYVNTAEGDIIYSGRTWHGLLESKVIQPPAGADYLTLTGDANDVLGRLIVLLGLGELFEAEESDSGLHVSSYRMNRYIKGYEGIRKMLASVGGKLRVTFVDGKVRLAAAPRSIPVDADDLDSDGVEIEATKHYNPTNHLVCLGRGELKDREVLHLYVDAAGNVGAVQHFFGLAERMDTYDNPNAESMEDLEAGGMERLKELAQTDEVKVSVSEDDDAYDVQDVISAKDHTTGLTVQAEVTKKIVTIDSGDVTVSYELGG